MMRSTVKRGLKELSGSWLMVWMPARRGRRTRSGSVLHGRPSNKTRAAEELKVSRRNLIRLVQKYELE